MRAREWKSLGWFVIVIVCVLGPIFFAVSVVTLTRTVDENAKTAYVTTCEQTNDVRAQLLAFVDSTLIRAADNTRAVLASPTATREQKAVAERNLANVQEFLEDASQRLAPSDCSYPPKE
jgi:hypothetical protein